MPQLLREPLLHFIVLAGLIFLAFTLLDDTPEPVAASRLEVTEQDVETLAARFKATWKREPSDAELSKLIDSHINEEVLVREALTLGLDQGDAIVRQRLVLKMRFLLEAGAEAADPTDEELNAFIKERGGQFKQSAQVSFEQIVLDSPLDEATTLLAALREGTPAEEVGRPSLLPPAMRDATPRVVDGAFGRGFFEQIARLPQGEWGGPVESGFGLHLVRVTAFEPAVAPPLDQIRDIVRQEWIAEQSKELAQSRLDLLKARYDFVRPDLSGSDR